MYVGTCWRRWGENTWYNNTRQSMQFVDSTLARLLEQFGHETRVTYLLNGLPIKAALAGYKTRTHQVNIYLATLLVSSEFFHLASAREMETTGEKTLKFHVCKLSMGLGPHHVYPTAMKSTTIPTAEAATALPLENRPSVLLFTRQS